MKDFYGIPGTIKSLSIRNVEEREIDATKLVNTMNRGELSELYLPVFTTKIVNKVSKDIIGEFNALKTINENVAIFDGLGLDDLANNINITSISFFQIKGGNLSSLAKLTKLNTMIFRSYAQNNGDIMDFITPWIQAGRTSGKVNVQRLLEQNNVTLNGQPITYPSGVSDSNAYLNWTSDGTVTFTAS